MYSLIEWASGTSGINITICIINLSCNIIYFFQQELIMQLSEQLAHDSSFLLTSYIRGVKFIPDVSREHRKWERRNKENKRFSPLRGVTHQYSDVVSTVRLARQESKPFQSNFPPVQGEFTMTRPSLKTSTRKSIFVIRLALILLNYHQNIRYRNQFDIRFGIREYRCLSIVRDNLYLTEARVVDNKHKTLTT